MVCANVLYGRLGSSTSQYPCTTVLICYSGTSFVLTPLKIKLMYYVRYTIPLKDIIKVNTGIVIGTTIRKFVDENGKDVFLP